MTAARLFYATTTAQEGIFLTGTKTPGGERVGAPSARPRSSM